eukprot:767577-Hanusia_phi.AAC.12
MKATSFSSSLPHSPPRQAVLAHLPVATTVLVLQLGTIQVCLTSSSWHDRRVDFLPGRSVRSKQARPKLSSGML